MIAARYFIQNAKKTKNGLGILFIANSCEEGLGNSMGAYTVLKNYGKRVKFFISNDGVIGSLVNVAVGSHRYEVEVTTPGGHSYGAFGKKNALYELSDLLHELYQVELPVKPGKKTTFNVGKIEGGTSVNTIA